MSVLTALPLILLTHTAGLSGGSYVVQGGVLHGRLSFQRGELSSLLEASGGELAKALDLQLDRQGRTCLPEGFESQPEEEDGVLVRFRAPCGLSAGEVVVIHLGFLERGGTGHRHYYEANGGGALLDGIAYGGASEIRLSIQGQSTREWMRWTLPVWLVWLALGLGLGTRRHSLEVFAASAVSSVLLVGAGAAAALVPRGSYLDLAAPIFAFYLAAEAFYAKRPARRVALAVPAGLLIAFVFLAIGRPDGVVEDRVVRGLGTFLAFGLLPGGLALALSSLVSARWSRATAVLVGGAAAVVAVLALGQR